LLQTSRSPQSNADESDVNELEKLENLLRNALKDTRSRKVRHFFLEI